jgi:Fe-S oxidoreductase
MVIELRTLLVEDGRIPGTLTTALKSIFERGNPLVMPARDRGAWVGDLEIKHLEEGADVFLYVGCMASYDMRGQKVAQAMARVFGAAEIDFGILAEDERCCGSEVRRSGEQGEDSLFEMLVEEWDEEMAEYQYQSMVTISPHCYDAFKHHYPSDGRRVEHYTQILDRLIKDDRIAFSTKIERTVTYHDPCYLGRQNQVYDEPRSVLKALPGLKYVEMDRSREKSLCCEGGGGRAWVEDPNPEKKLAVWRVEEALSVGAEVIATACPFCMQMLEDAVRTTGMQDRIRIMDVVELAAEAL